MVKICVWPLVLWCLAWEADVMLVSVLGCFSCGEALCFTLRAMVPGLGGGGDASFGARMLGMWRRVVFDAWCYDAWPGRQR